MGKKSKSSVNGLVYSTDPDFRMEDESKQDQVSAPANQQKLRVRLETKHRAGKIVTIIEGFSGTTSDMEDLGKKLKNYCGTGGSVKDGEIIVQGDHREKVLQFLLKNGYTGAKRSGG
jgi:translation initiation factor 1